MDAVTRRPEPDFLQPPVRANGPIILAEPDPAWAGQYAREEARIRTGDVFTVGNPEVERMLRFRDRLRAQPDERDLYLRTKRELANRRWNYIQDYADAKSSVVEGIISRAQAAANPGPPGRVAT